jgi:uncharacterized protein (DUF362 family)
MSADLYLVTDIPIPDFAETNHHAGVDCLLKLMAGHGLKLYRSPCQGPLSGPSGLISPDDVVLLKVNAQWKYRGCTNSDVVRGLIQRILEHPDGFSGEVVLFDNGQGQGSMEGDARGWGRYSDDAVQANAENPLHSFSYLANSVFAGRRVSTYLLDDVREVFIAETDHQADGYRIWEGVSYPCFTTAGGNRVELREGVWDGTQFVDRIKLINMPVLKTHDGCGVTACLKNYYGVLSMGHPPRDYHYGEAGQVWGEMIARVRAPVLHLLDCIWISLRHHCGYPASNTSRLNRLLAGVDPVALDYWASKYLFYPVSGDPNDHPDHPELYTDSNLDMHLAQARDTINRYGGVHGHSVTRDEREMRLFVGRP